MINPNQPSIHQLLYELNELYHSAPMAAYETALQAEVMQVQQVFPGFTIAYAEIYVAGSEREPHGGMRHVLLPLQALHSFSNPDVEKVLGNHPAPFSCSPTRCERPAGLPLAGKQDKAPPDC